MIKKYFPGANSGKGFFSRFSGIAPPWDEPHYTYILKGGPGVGKSTLMKKVAERARAAGCDVEEFRCASDPDSLDAVRIVQRRVILVDGTSPHTIDPRMPGVLDETVNLGCFKNQKEFFEKREELERYARINSECYRTAYACLAAAMTLKKEALVSVLAVIDKEKMQKYLSSVIGPTKKGDARELFAKSVTPRGVVDYSKSYLRDGTLWLSGIVGEVAMEFAQRMLCGRQHTVCYDFVVPTLPQTLDTGERSIAIEKNGDDLSELLISSVPHGALFCMSEAEKLVAQSAEALSKALATHDKIEELYRPHVDYDMVNELCDLLVRRLEL